MPADKYTYRGCEKCGTGWHLGLRCVMDYGDPRPRWDDELPQRSSTAERPADNR